MGKGKGTASHSANPPPQPPPPPPQVNPLGSPSSPLTPLESPTSSGSGLVDVVEGASVAANHGIIQPTGTLSTVRTDVAIDPHINMPKDAPAGQLDEDEQ
ncbi:hypothetical protein BDQ17DRAFT_1438051 [Cyathus striatus]|nr:hypothetical protein BDQ17DRAFT_1438051 [Cyathus striatus]